MGKKPTVEIANTQQTGSLEAGGQRVDNAVVIWQRKCQWSCPGVSHFSQPFQLTGNHRQAVAHGDQVRTIGCRAISRLGVNLLLGETERAGILAQNGNILPSQTLKALTGNITERGREIDEVNLIEEPFHWEKSGHGLNVVSAGRLAENSKLQDLDACLLHTQCRHQPANSDCQFLCLSKLRSIRFITYINPDCLARLDLLVLHFVLQLRRNQTEHVLTTMEETTAGSIVDSGLVVPESALCNGNLPSSLSYVSFIPASTYLSLVEALQRTLLALNTLVMGLDETGPDEFDICERAMIHINLELLEGNHQDEPNEGKDQKGRAGDVDVQPIHIEPVCERESEGEEEEEEELGNKGTRAGREGSTRGAIHIGWEV